MSPGALLEEPAVHLDYSLTGLNARSAVEKGLAEAEWYQCPVPKQQMRALLERRDGPALRDTAIWFFLLWLTGLATYELRGRWLAVLPYLAYAVLYASISDSRWHESGHGTAFKSDWMNNALYELFSFMVMRESVIWRWSHNRHHSDTIIVGRDPEIAVPRPPDVKGIAMSFFNLGNYPKYFKRIALHAIGRMSEEEKTFVPETEYRKVFFRARIYVLLYALVVAAAIGTHSLLPLFLVGLTNMFGTWLLVVYGLTQHAGLAENVLDHRLNCRTVYLNRVHRFLYWNMNYHVEHHMFPLVPYHALPRLHEAVKDDCPAPYLGLLAAWREIVPAVRKQLKDPAYHVKRPLPLPLIATRALARGTQTLPDADGWMEVCKATDLRPADVIRFDHGYKTYAIYRDAEGALYATDGICSHGNVHLSEGLVIGKMIECSKHNGRFNLLDGTPARTPICRGLATYPVEQREGALYLNVRRPGGAALRKQKVSVFRVVSNENVATFIKELVLLPVDPEEQFSFLPGDYLQLDIPTYDSIRYSEFDIPEPFATVWRMQHVFDLVAHNPDTGRRNNYSIASNGRSERTLRFNVRIATPPPGQDCLPGAGSSYLFSLKPGDMVSGIGPFGDFHVKPTKREMIYLGAGAGMAPLRAHLSHLLETERSARKISFWYGARSAQELFYQDYFKQLETEFGNFSFRTALSSPLPDDHWTGRTGYVHEVLLAEYLRTHSNPRAVEYYLCGPPAMVKACTGMLASLGVPTQQISFDEF